MNTVEQDIFNVDLYKKTYEELKSLPPEKQTPSQIREGLVKKLTEEKTENKKGNITAVIAAYYYHTKGNSDFDFLRESFYTNTFSGYINTHYINLYFNEIVNNDDILIPILEISDQSVIKYIYDLCERQNNINKRLGNDEYEEVFNKINRYYVKPNITEVDNSVIEKFVPTDTLTMDEIRTKKEQLADRKLEISSEEKGLKYEERMLERAENKKIKEMVLDTADALNIDYDLVQKSLNKNGIDLHSVSSIDVSKEVPFTTKVKTVPKNVFKKIAYRASMRNMVKSLTFTLDGNNLVINKKEKFSLKEKIASTDNEIIRKIVNNSASIKDKFLSCADLGKNAISSIKTQFEKINETYSLLESIYEENEFHIEMKNPVVELEQPESLKNTGMNFDLDKNIDIKEIFNVRDRVEPIVVDNISLDKTKEEKTTMFKTPDGRTYRVRAVGGNKVGEIPNLKEVKKVRVA